MLDNVACSGSEMTLLECTATTSHNCGHHQDAGVTCGNLAIARWNASRHELGLWGLVGVYAPLLCCLL